MLLYVAVALNWLITLLIWHHGTIFSSPTWTKTLSWEAVSDWWWGHIWNWRLFRGTGRELLYHMGIQSLQHRWKKVLTENVIVFLLRCHANGIRIQKIKRNWELQFESCWDHNLYKYFDVRRKYVEKMSWTFYRSPANVWKHHADALRKQKQQI